MSVVLTGLILLFMVWWIRPKFSSCMFNGDHILCSPPVQNMQLPCALKQRRLASWHVNNRRRLYINILNYSVAQIILIHTESFFAWFQTYSTANIGIFLHLSEFKICGAKQAVNFRRAVIIHTSSINITRTSQNNKTLTIWPLSQHLGKFLRTKTFKLPAKFSR
jgi:hypothetical protein